MILAIDVGGTKVLVAILNDKGVIQASKKFKTSQAYPEFLATLKTTIAEVTGRQQLEACSIALPGSIDREKGIAEHFGNLPWENVALSKDLADLLQCPIYLENDAKMAGLAEAHEVKDLYNRVLYITVSTGIGLGLTVDGKIDHSVHDAGGKGIMVEHQGKIMAWEDFASGKAIVAQTGKMASDITDDHDWYMIAHNLAIGIIDLIVLLSPQLIVIGGGVGTHLPKFHEQLWAELELLRSKMISSLPQISQAAHPEEAVIYGGYILAKQMLDQSPKINVGPDSIGDRSEHSGLKDPKTKGGIA